MRSLGENRFLLSAALAGLGWFLTPSAQAQYTFGAQVQSTNTASITYSSATGAFQYTDAANLSDDTASVPLTGSYAGLITSSSGWHASLTMTVAAKSMSATSEYSPGDGMGISVVSVQGTNEYYVSIVCGQVNNTGNADADFPHNFYGTGSRFLARINGTNETTTSLGASGNYNGDSILSLSGATNAVAATEAIGAVAGVVTLGCNATTETVTGYIDGIPVGSYSIAGWGSNPPLTLYVFGSSGEGVGVSAGANLATNFNAGAGAFSLPQLAVAPSGTNVILTWPTNASGFKLESSLNLSPAVWSTNVPAALVVNGQYSVTISANGAQRFFRLAQ
jgi:hypothetical protein